MDLRVGKSVRTQEVPKVDFDQEGFTYPLKGLYDKANYSLEGLSVPYEIDDSYVKAKSIDTFDMPKKKGSMKPVGEPIAYEEPPASVPPVPQHDAQPPASEPPLPPPAEPPQDDVAHLFMSDDEDDDWAQETVAATRGCWA